MGQPKDVFSPFPKNPADLVVGALVVEVAEQVSKAFKGNMPNSLTAVHQRPNVMLPARRELRFLIDLENFFEIKSCQPLNDCSTRSLLPSIPQDTACTRRSAPLFQLKLWLQWLLDSV